MNNLKFVEPDSLRGALEALLLVSTEPVSAKTLAESLQVDDEDVTKTLKELSQEYLSANRGFQIREVAGGWRLFTHPAFSEVVADYVLSWDTRKLSQAALETLTIIAYYQPVTREGIKAVRGVNSDGVIASLLEKRLIRQVGRDSERGQAILYGTSKEFLEQFGLKSLKDLPDLEQFVPDEKSQEFIRQRLSSIPVQVEFDEFDDDVDDELDQLDEELFSQEDLIDD